MCHDLHFTDQLFHFGVVLLLDAVVIVEFFYTAYMIAELESVTVKCILVLASGDVGDKSVQVNRRLVERAPFSCDAWSMFCSVARVFVIIDRCLNVPWLDA